MNLVNFHLLFEPTRNFQYLYLNQFLLFTTIFYICSLQRKGELGKLEIIGSKPEDQFGHLQRA